MALRASAPESEQGPDLAVATGRATGDGNVPHGAFLCALAEAVARWRWDEVATLRRTGIDVLGAQPTCDAILVAAGFNGITRVADAIGIRLDQRTEAASAGFRDATGISAFAPPEKWQVPGASA